MDSEESLLVLVYCSGKKKSNRHGVKFTDKEPLSVFIRSTDTLSDLKRNILQKTGLCGAKFVKKVFYKIPMAVVSSGVQYETFVIGSDEDMEVLFHCRRSFPEFRGFSAKFSVDDGRGASTSMPVVAPGSLLAAPPLFLAPAARSPGLITGLVGSGEPDEAHTFRGQGLHEGNTSGEFQIGQSFQTKEEVVMSVKDYSIRRGVQYRVMESDHLKYVERCKEFGNGCTRMICMALRQRKGNWEVRRYNGAHTCLATSILSDHRQLDYHVICARIYPLVRTDAAVTIKVLQEATESTYGFRPSYRKVWKAKEKAVAQIYGDWEESYAELSRWILGMQATKDGTVALLKTSPVRPLISIDGTHLHGKYGWTLLLAIVQDENSNILSVAFALVEGENAESWTFFLSHLRQHVTPQEGILVISNRHNGIKAALEVPDSGWLPPHAYRAYCIRHVVANFALSFKGQDARRLLVNAAYAKTEAEFDYWFDIMRTENPAMCDWANRLEYDKWTQHQDGGRRFGHMTTNISECVNSVLKGTRNLPITALVKCTYGRLAELFVV
ncbi:uncharacterized protein LOC107641288 [Arachis ipaensis]|uniref:uncharacterized protein LOC107641288 n=1 Tax=Arachis ipaensis TaxID=130454 RepID=UPI0007AF7482|nr:uncharacterized protein LOC107641288 [Arachis ipaensis]XP_025653275.1 uncharacterized protein LOC112749230 [Arachis hypogaea]